MVAGHCLRRDVGGCPRPFTFHLSLARKNKPVVAVRHRRIEDDSQGSIVSVALSLGLPRRDVGGIPGRR